MDEKAVEYDKCVVCGVETEEPKDRNIHMRYGYMEGAGQLCRVCATKFGV